MTHQMADVTAEIRESVDKLCESGADMSKDDEVKVLNSIEMNGNKVTEILNDMLHANS
jgi:hypothetical protein